MPALAQPIRNARLIVVGLLAVAVLGAGPCSRDETPPATDTATALAEAKERAAQERLEAALAAETAANEAADKALAEREALLETREEQLRREQSLRDQEARNAARRAELEQREEALAVREKELDNFEANLTFQEKELRDREALVDEDLGAATGDPPQAGERIDTEGEVETEFEEPLEGEWSDEAPVETDIEGATFPDAEPEFRQASLQPGRLLEVEILETLTSRNSSVGDIFSGRLVQDLRAEDGTLVVAAGAEVIGRVTYVKPLKSVGGRAALDVEFTHIVVSPTESIAISASFVELGADKRSDKKKIAGAAIVGAILGRVLGGDTDAAVAGAAAGAAIRTAAVARAKGKDAEIPAGETVALQLDEVVTVSVEMTGPADG